MIFRFQLSNSFPSVTGFFYDSVDDMMSIPEFYAGQSIFITGGTGLMGKVLIEKLLRSCPEVERLYILIRPKKNENIEERWSKITSLPLFDRLKSEQPKGLEKITLVPGSVEKNLGVSDDHKKLLFENVTIIYHVAAMVQFTNSIRKALVENVAGTMYVAEFARCFKNLKVFVHVSTAYCNYNIGPTKSYEEVIPSYYDWKFLLKMFEKDPAGIEILRDKLLCGHPNPYTWSKSLAEQVINDYRNYFPVIIMRPAIVFGAKEEPLTGWTDAANSYNALSYATGLGLVRVLNSRRENSYDFIPVDFAIKALIIGPWKRHLRFEQGKNDGEDKTVDVYNCSIGKNTKMTTYDVEIYCGESIDMYPSVNQVWKRSITRIENRRIFFFVFFFLQVLPAAIADLVLFFLGKPRMALKMTRKLQDGFILIGSIFRQLEPFPNEGFADLGRDLHEEDTPIFSYNVCVDNIRQFLYDQTYGFRNYCIKEDLSEETCKKGRQRLQIICAAQKTLKFVWNLSLLWFLWNYIKSIYPQLYHKYINSNISDILY